LEVESNNWNGEFLWFFWYHLKLISFSKFFTQKCCNKRFVLSDSDDNNDQEIQTFSLNNVEIESDVSDHSVVIEMDSISSDSYNLETIEGRKEPDFKTPISPAPSPTPLRKKKGMIKRVLCFVRRLCIT
jgi:hypothetical protein